MPKGVYARKQLSHLAARAKMLARAVLLYREMREEMPDAEIALTVDGEKVFSYKRGAEQIEIGISTDVDYWIKRLAISELLSLYTVNTAGVDLNDEEIKLLDTCLELLGKSELIRRKKEEIGERDFSVMRLIRKEVYNPVDKFYDPEYEEPVRFRRKRNQAS